jgi:hypothetical protein
MRVALPEEELAYVERQCRLLGMSSLEQWLIEEVSKSKEQEEDGEDWRE